MFFRAETRQASIGSAYRKKKKGKVKVGLEFADQLNCSFRQ